MTEKIPLTINGITHTREVAPRLLLIHFLRDVMELTGAHIGCDTSHCGACTVLLNGRSVKSCTVFAVQVAGSEIQTIEGLSGESDEHPLQTAFREEHGLQCGYCTPGMVLRAKELLAGNPDPDEKEIRRGLAGNLCRCTGYVNIVRAIQRAAKAGK